MKSKSLILIFIVIILFGINFGTSPTVPYHRYIVDGFVLCDSISDMSNFTIQLFGKSLLNQTDYLPISYSGLAYERPIVITDSTGSYSIISNSYFYFDSIKIAIMHPRGAIIFSEANFIDRNLAVPIQGQGEDIGTSSGCSSCTDEPASFNFILRYEHYLNANINYCN